MHRSVNHAQFEFLDLESNAGAPRARSTHVHGERQPTGTKACRVVMDQGIGTLWVRLEPDCAAKFTPALLTDLRTIQERIAAYLQVQATHAPANRLRYQVFASAIPGVFSLGGDLSLFRDCIRRQDAHTLRRYAHDAVDLVYVNATAYDAPLTTISLVQGQALGGGFEAALAAHVLVAERSARMGLPEVLFNMFPGMGAYQLLSRRLSPVEAERMILSGRTYTAEELHGLGIVDVLADDGDGEQAVRRYIRSHDRQWHGQQGFRRAVNAARPLDRHELYRMVDVWVETALGLGERDLSTIDYLLRAQQRLTARGVMEHTPAELLKKA